VLASGSSLKKRNLKILAGFGFDFAAVRALILSIAGEHQLNLWRVRHTGALD
jgi:hypothetical protein